jgi:type IV pilus assembly protein PilC
MPRFRYKAARPDGTMVEARAEADSEFALRTQLENQGLLIFDLRGPRAGAIPLPRRSHGGRLSLREFLVFNQEFVALVRAGLPILKACDLLADRATHAGFQAALQGVRTEIRGGASISDAMERYPNFFSDLYRASLRSGEQTGNLVEVLQRYIAYLKLVISVREKVLKALAYPAFLIIVGLGVVTFLLMYVMPTFSEIYGQAKADLPGPTRLLLTAVEQARAWLPWIAAGGAAGGAALYQGLRTEGGRLLLNRVSLRLPIVGDILLKSQIVRMARTLSTILAGGIPLVNALTITSGAMTNRILSQALLRTTDRVREGVGLAASLKQEGFMPQMTLEMIEVGETTGALESMLQDVAEFHESELDLRLSQLTTWIEPVLLFVMGILVGGIVIVMYLPVFQIAGAV